MSQVQKFYTGQNVFITGGTGFLGKILTEKLIRGCPNIGTIYLLIRAKKGKSAQERIDELLADSVFDVLRDDHPDFSKKIVEVTGDITEEGLGLSTIDHARLVNEVSVIFHLAATVRLNEKLETALAMNVDSVKYMLDIAKACKNLKVGIYVSTAYSHCVRKSINEELYPPPLSYKGANKLIEDIRENKSKWSEEEMKNFTEGVLGEWPNTYSFTKAIAEGVIAEFANEIPFAVFRPSIVSATYNEPIPGWTSSLAGQSGAICALLMGILHVILIKNSARADVVPVDLVCNSLITCAWDVAVTERRDKDIPVYNYTSGSDSPITWKKILDTLDIYGHLYPSNAALYYNSLIFTESTRLFLILNFILHMIPALIIDNIARIFGREPGLYRLACKIRDFQCARKHFTSREWDFENQRVQNLWKRIGPEDRRTFPFSMQNFDWDEHLMKMIKGVRKYALGDRDGNQEDARRRQLYLYMVHTVLRLTFGIFVLWITWKIFSGCSF